MGGCCQKLESIDHVESLEDLKYIIQTDLELFKKQNKTLIEDKSLLNKDTREKKIDYFNFLISNLKIVEKDLDDIIRLKEEEIKVFKNKYKNMLNCIHLQDQVKLEKCFSEIHNYIEKFARPQELTTPR